LIPNQEPSIKKPRLPATALPLPAALGEVGYEWDFYLLLGIFDFKMDMEVRVIPTVDCLQIFCIPASTKMSNN
jgi:hypothetical protein